MCRKNASKLSLHSSHTAIPLSMYWPFLHRPSIRFHVAYSGMCVTPRILECLRWESDVRSFCKQPHDFVIPLERLPFRTTVIFPHSHKHSISGSPLLVFPASRSANSLPNRLLKMFMLCISPTAYRIFVLGPTLSLKSFTSLYSSGDFRSGPILKYAVLPNNGVRSSPPLPFLCNWRTPAIR